MKEDTPLIDISPRHLKIVQDILQKHIPDYEVWAYGSRVTWTAKEYSDLDLAVKGNEALSSQKYAILTDAFDESDLTYKVDIVDWEQIQPGFQKIIKKKYLVLQKKNNAKSLGCENKLEDFVTFNPRRDIVKGEYAPYVDMASIQEHNKDIQKFILKKYQGGGAKFANGDTLLARLTPCLENGKSSLVRGIPSNGFGSTEFIVMTPKESKDDSDFIYYITRFAPFREYAIKNMSGTSGRQRVSWQRIAEYDFTFPSKKYRKAAGNVLRKYDNLIQVNMKLNSTLEKIAQAFFKSWFVDFDPVHAKKLALEKGLSKKQAERAAMAVISGVCSPKDFADNFKEMDQRLEQRLSKMSGKRQKELAHTASLFPGEFVDSDLGKIPRGWSVSTIGKNVEILDSKRVPLSKKQREKISGDIPYYGATSCMGYVNDYIFDEELVLIGEDGSVMDENGFPFMQYIWGKSWVNNHAHVLRGVGYFNNPHLYFLLKQTNITAFVTGAVQLKINQGNLKSIKFVKSPTRLSLVYNNLTNSFVKNMINNSDENQRIENLRDTLLPKLLAGEIDISKIRLDEDAKPT